MYEQWSKWNGLVESENDVALAEFGTWYYIECGKNHRTVWIEEKVFVVLQTQTHAVRVDASWHAIQPFGKPYKASMSIECALYVYKIS